MRTREARRMRDRALKDARKQGHNVALISKSGAIELYGCLNDCDSIMDIWDSPAIVNGPMPEVKCRDGRQSPSFWVAIATFVMSRGMWHVPARSGPLKYFYSWAEKFRSPS